MRNIVKVSVAALGLMLGLSSCDSFFAEMPGIRVSGFSWLVSFLLSV